jgi:hypothetical protein
LQERSEFVVPEKRLEVSVLEAGEWRLVLRAVQGLSVRVCTKKGLLVVASEGLSLDSMIEIGVRIQNRVPLVFELPD